MSCDGFGEPRYTAGHPDGRHAYVTDAKRGEVVALDVLRGRRCRARAGRGARPSRHHRSKWPHALDRARRRRPRQIAVVDITQRASPRLVRRFRPPFLAHDVGWAARTANASLGQLRRPQTSWRSTPRVAVAVPTRLRGRQAPAALDLPRPAASTWRAARAARCASTGSTGPCSTRQSIPEDSYNVQQAHGWVVTPGLGTGTLCLLDRDGRVRFRRTIARSSHDDRHYDAVRGRS